MNRNFDTRIHCPPPLSETKILEREGKSRCIIGYGSLTFTPQHISIEFMISWSGNRGGVGIGVLRCWLAGNKPLKSLSESEWQVDIDNFSYQVSSEVKSAIHLRVRVSFMSLFECLLNCLILARLDNFDCLLYLLLNVAFWLDVT